MHVDPLCFLDTPFSEAIMSDEQQDLPGVEEDQPVAADPVAEEAPAPDEAAPADPVAEEVPEVPDIRTFKSSVTRTELKTFKVRCTSASLPLCVGEAVDESEAVALAKVAVGAQEGTFVAEAQ